jgi:uncharacterized protein YjiS (DUF1127 family)
MVTVVQASLTNTEDTMTRHYMTLTTAGQAAAQAPGTLLDRPFDRLLAILQEWRTRRYIKRELGHLSDLHLRDAGLTRADIEAACADRFDRSSARALKSAAQNRTGNW